MRYRDGYTITTSNLKGFKNYPLRDMMSGNFRVPVRLDNEANAQAFCELKFGAGRGYDDLIFLTVSSGIGAGIVLIRKIYRGMTGTAGEFGHTIVGKMVLQGLEAGDPVSVEIVRDCADYIGIGIYNIFQVFNPPLIILGGGLMNLGDLYFSRILEKFHELARDMIYDPIAVVRSESGADAGLIGAAALLLE